MNFQLDEQQLSLRATVDRLLEDNYSFEQRNAALKTDRGWHPDIWNKFARLGLLGVALPEESGGSAGGARDIMVLSQAMGRKLVLEPFLSTAVLGATAVLLGCNEKQKSRILPQVVRGEMKLAWAHTERAHPHQTFAVATTAERKVGGWRLNGTKCMILHGGIAETFVVSARVSGAVDDYNGLALFLVEKDAPGLQIRSHRLQDSTLASEVSLTDVAGALMEECEQAGPIIDRVQGRGIAALCAGAVGAMDAAYAMTLEYVQTRHQFGQAIGKNQVVQHRVVDMLIALEKSTSMMWLASSAADEALGERRNRSLSHAKLLVGANGVYLTQQAIQLHGAIGLTEEYPVGSYFRHLLVVDQLFGDRRHHLSLLAA